MRQFKSTLTRLKNSIVEKLPEGPDVYGFQGVTKVMLVKTCDDMHALAGFIETKDESQEFEIIVLKRLEAKLSTTLKKFLDEDAGSGREKEKFDEFLDKFSKLYEKTKQVYFIVNKDGLRDDMEIQTLREQIVALTSQKDEYESLIGELREKSENATAQAAEVERTLGEAYNNIDERVTNSQAASTAIQAALEAVTEWHKKIDETYNKMEGWDSDIEATNTSASENLRLTKELMEQLEKGTSGLNEAVHQSAALTTETNQIHESNQELIREIQETLGDANRVGMAASYKVQMHAMERTMGQWKWTFMGTLGGFALVSIGIIVWHLFGDNSTWGATLTRFGMTAPLIWLAWFAVRQYGFANRVREDYTYKYATAMAYEGYKKAVREAAPDLEKALIEVAIMNMAENPVRLYSPRDSDHATPFSEMVDKLFGRVKKLNGKVGHDGVSAEAELEKN